MDPINQVLVGQSQACKCNSVNGSAVLYSCEQCKPSTLLLHLVVVGLLMIYIYICKYCNCKYILEVHYTLHIRSTS